jgi:mRNA interferase MazF
VVSPPEIHDNLRTAIIAPLTSQGFPAPFRIPIRHRGRKGLILLDQFRAVDKSRLQKLVGALSPAHLSIVLAAFAELFSEY